MSFRKVKRITTEDPPAPLSEMTLVELRNCLKKEGGSRPKYLFGIVEKNTDLADYRYVFWLDLMGARNMMKLSLPRAARSVMKIHAAALSSKENHPHVEVNPVMDGVYGVVKDRSSLESCLCEILTSLSHVFVRESNPANRFIVRAGIAFGPLVTGKALANGALIFKENPEYLRSTAIGMAITHAYEAEGNAPPFGVFIHESARAFAPSGKGNFPYLTNLWTWFEGSDALSWGLKRTLLEHFDWVQKNKVASQYDSEAMKRHMALASEYFAYTIWKPLARHEPIVSAMAVRSNTGKSKKVETGSCRGYFDADQWHGVQAD